MDAKVSTKTKTMTLQTTYKNSPLVTHGNTKGFGLIPLSGARCDYMSPLLKIKTNIELDNHKGFEDFL